jgi:Fe-S cluster assembly protein SufD
MDERTAGDPEFLHDLRRQALESFRASLRPDRAVHLWRYTDPKRLDPDGFEATAAALPVDADTLARTDVTVGALADLIGDDAVSKRFATLAGTGERYEALNLALHSGATVVRASRGARVEAPVKLAYRVGEDGSLQCPRTLIIVEEGAELSVVEEVLTDNGAGAESLVHGVTEVFLEPGASLVHAVINELGQKVRARLVQRAYLDRASTLTSISVSLGGALVKTEGSAVLAGEGAHSKVLGAVFGTARQHLDAHWYQDHAARRTFSDLLVRVALRERARASYTGQLRVAPNAPHCEAHQENRNLLLTDSARADSIPELEILTHEVECSHAASTGPVDPAMMFFLRSRGLDPLEAERLVVLGFLEPVFGRIPSKDLADVLRGAASVRLGGTAKDAVEDAHATLDGGA